MGIDNKLTPLGGAFRPYPGQLGGQSVGEAAERGGIVRGPRERLDGGHEGGRDAQLLGERLVAELFKSYRFGLLGIDVDTR